MRRRYGCGIPAPGGSLPNDPPAPRERPTIVDLHGERLVDEYAWLRDRDDPEVHAHLQAENAYTDAVLEGQAELERSLFEEMRARVQEDDASAPIRRGDWWYGTRSVAGAAYVLHVRRPVAGGPEEVILDENALSEGAPGFHVGRVLPSPDHRRLAVAVDPDGRERYTLRFRDLETGEWLQDAIDDTKGDLCWGSDSATVLYVRGDEAERPCEIRAYTLGTGEDARVWYEPDDRFFVEVRRTRDGRFLLLESHSKRTSELHFVPADAPRATPRVVWPRVDGVEYDVESAEDGGEIVFFVRTNRDAPRFAVWRARAEAPADAAVWLPERERASIIAMRALRDHLVLVERDDATPRVVIVRRADRAEHTVATPDPAWHLHLDEHPEADTSTVRFVYESMVRPPQHVAYDAEARSWTLLKEKPVRGYDPARYVSERRHAVAPDGTRVPISLVYRRDLGDGPRPCWLGAYGAYGTSYPADFGSRRISLLDRGFVFAIAHVRGGGDGGQPWYEAGRLAQKPNSIADFIAVAEHLFAAGITTPEKLAVTGGSAGGLLIGAVLNARPDLCAAAVVQVPFVDLIHTMRDPSLPLTVTEWEEWGNPADPEQYAWLRAYSPYDNVREAAYPAIFATAGLNDPRVGYWEPAKWIARLRRAQRADRPLLLRVYLGAGHAGESGRYGKMRESAAAYAFVLRALGVSP